MISSGTEAMGQGGAGERSVGGDSPVMESVVNELRRDWRGADSPWREWWAGLGTVTGALEGFGSWGFRTGGGDVAGVFEEGFGWEVKNEGGKCFAL